MIQMQATREAMFSRFPLHLCERGCVLVNYLRTLLTLCNKRKASILPPLESSSLCIPSFVLVAILPKKLNKLFKDHLRSEDQVINVAWLLLSSYSQYRQRPTQINKQNHHNVIIDMYNAI